MIISRILIVEDDKIKIEKLQSFFSSFDVTVKESYHNGLKALVNSQGSFDLLILDMTIPLWEKGGNDLSGSFEQFGGERILREMKRRKLNTPTVLVTMFDIFALEVGNLTFAELDSRFKEQFSEFYLGAVFYNASDDSWKIDLKALIGGGDD